MTQVATILTRAALPKAFRHQRLGYVDAYVMHRFLDDVEA